MLKKLTQPPSPKLERFALLFFSIGLVFAVLSFASPWKGVYEQTANAAVSFASIYTASVAELGDQSSGVYQNELNVGLAWDAWQNYLAGVLDSGGN